ncbi:hypothetical protein PRIPAC_80456 [Pristionchus pacificus]|uniref:Uncharacterized protein n=1 Tax=Pristionchus pacificus TaxID=54126 RepID=A0A2A6C3J9_PRIPA|nr:hypothetical protein PRIPAC_80456 [Pristionchus pacificus]|eukprot:PDM72613.1 hypothetical protein PRIPAC_39047 [Pristionchus pacificus]
MLPLIIVFIFLYSNASAACTDLYTKLVRADSNPALLIVSDASRFQCLYNVNTIAGLPPAAGTCDLSCPADSQVIAMYPEASQPVYLSGTHFDSGNWTGMH